MNNKLTINVDRTEVYEILERVERLHELLKDANSFADELAKKDININLSIND